MDLKYGKFHEKQDTEINEKSDDDNANDANDDNDENSQTKSYIYIQPVILENINLDKYFSRKDIDTAKRNNKELKITDKGLYSITKYEDAEWISHIIIKFIESNDNIKSKNMHIIDATAGIGGNTINFAKYFRYVSAIEINDIHYSVLYNNINALQLSNISTFNQSFLVNLENGDNYGKAINNTIFFFDPPWGGKSYKNFKYFNLKIGKLYIYNVINMLHAKKYKYVVLKAPYNLNVSPILGNVKYENMNIYKNYKKNMVLVIFY